MSTSPFPYLSFHTAQLNYTNLKHRFQLVDNEKSNPKKHKKNLDIRMEIDGIWKTFFFSPFTTIFLINIIIYLIPGSISPPNFKKGKRKLYGLKTDNRSWDFFLKSISWSLSSMKSTAPDCSSCRYTNLVAPAITVMNRRYVVIGFCVFSSAPLIAPILLSRVYFQISTVLNIYSNIQMYCTVVTLTIPIILKQCWSNYWGN